MFDKDQCGNKQNKKVVKTQSHKVKKKKQYQMRQKVTLRPENKVIRWRHMKLKINLTGKTFLRLEVDKQLVIKTKRLKRGC